MKKGIFLNLIVFFFISYNIYGAELKSITFQQYGEISQLELVLDKEDVVTEKLNNIEGKQIFVDLTDVSATDKVMRAFDTSEFSGSVVFVRAYKKANPKDVRIAIQLRDNVRSVLKREGNKIILDIENRFGVFSQSDVEKNETEFKELSNIEAGKLHIPKSESIEDILENLTHSGRKKYIGKKVSFNVKDVSVEEILTMIADSSGFNIIITDEVKKLPPLTLNLTNIPWDQALDTILGLNKLVAQKNGIILLVTTLEKATAEKKMELDALKLTQMEEPLVTKIFPISYATASDIEKIVKEYLTKERGSTSLDERTNQLIVKDVPDVIEKIRKIVEALDTQTPQVLIESKIVEVSEGYAKELGLTNGFKIGFDPIQSLHSVTPAGPGFSFSSAPISGSGGANFFGLQVASWKRVKGLDFSLQLMESESKGKIIATPKVITQNKKTAELGTQDTTSYVKSSVVDGIQVNEFQEISAELNIKVTPQVTNEGSIILEVDMHKEHFGDRPFSNQSAPPTKARRAIKTNVLVENGSTVVIGGIYTFREFESHSGVPFLKDLPLIGWLFRTPYNPTNNKSEMVIFLTPRIINQEEAGLTNFGQSS